LHASACPLEKALKQNVGIQARHLNLKFVSFFSAHRTNFRLKKGDEQVHVLSAVCEFELRFTSR